jgi:parallel beta-helix repeat protein
MSGLLALAAVGLGVAGPAGAAPPAPLTLFVGCGPGSFPTIGAAVTAAAPGATIQVCSGTYFEGVVIPANKPLTLEGVGNPIISASGHNNGVLVLASGSTVEGFTVAEAIGEGILVQGGHLSPITNVTVANNVVQFNDQGNPSGAPITDSPYPQCNAQAGVPGDCGEGIHLWTAEGSIVANNQVQFNSGGILLTDEFGPTAHNLVQGNTASNNTLDCGITLAGHNPEATTSGSLGGVYDNSILDNTVNNNGVAGQGGGVLLATPLPGGGVYSNLVQGNSASGNGLAGVTVHSHAPGQDVNGNTIVDNFIGINNLDGDFDFSPLVNPFTTGVTVASVAPLSITVTGNTIVGDIVGIWITPPVSVSGAGGNNFVKVKVPVLVAS